MQLFEFLRRPKRWVFVLLLPLSGCLVNTHTLRRVEMPSNVMVASADQLIRAVNDRCDAIQSLSAIVEFQVIEGGPKKGKETTSTTFRGYILERKPGALRVTALLPYVESKAMDMATKGETFTLWIPVRNEVFEGPNTVSTPSQNALENIRPNVFSDSLLLSCVAPDDLVTLTSETKTVLDKRAQHLIAEPDYDLMVLRRKGNQELVTKRVVHFNRTNLIPYQEDIYDQDGAIQTEATYGPLKQFGSAIFPSTIAIRRPLDELQIRITIEKLTVNQPVPDEKFDLTIPEGTTVHKLN